MIGSHSYTIPIQRGMQEDCQGGDDLTRDMGERGNCGRTGPLPLTPRRSSTFLSLDFMLLLAPISRGMSTLTFGLIY
ncbi:unnamed protein product [Urochloa humidicola]